MTVARRNTASVRLIDRLPPVRGRLGENVPLSPITWFRVGGAAEVMFRPADVEDLACFLAARPEDVPVTVIGVGSNLLVRDGGVPGVVIRLGRRFVDIVAGGDGTIAAGAGALDVNVARVACDAGISGLEFLCGIPGTVGGAVRMNAGAYGREVRDTLTRAQVLDATGKVRTLTAAECGFGYRRSALPDDCIVVGACFAGTESAPERIFRRMEEIRASRESTQPIRARTGGSTFANPPGAKAWELIDNAGCRGLVRGGAQVSVKHCNFLINMGDATAADIEALGEEVRRRVLDHSGVCLEWEIRRIGVAVAAREGRRWE